MLRVSKVKQKIKEGRLVIRGFLRFPDPEIAEIMALSGVDLIVIDLEHFPVNAKCVESIVRAAEIHGAECIVRVQNGDPSRIALVMESGAQGIILPHCDTYEEALDAVKAVKYAPVGTRGFCPITRATGYGMRMGASEYAAFSNEQTMVFVMTETKTGLENLDRILSIPEIDGISIGPSDVSASFGYPGQTDHPVVKEAIAAGQKKVLSSGKALCTQAYNPDAAKRVYGMGSRILTVFSDVQMMKKMFEEQVRAMRALEEDLFIGSMQRISDPNISEVMALSGVDMICLDQEHYPFDAEKIGIIAAAIQAHGKCAMLRVPDDDPARISQMMDQGLDGIKVPHVESGEDAARIVSAVKFAPAGTRGFCPITRAADYGMTVTPTEFTVRSNRLTKVALMVETKEGLEHLDEILALEDVDMIAIGPSDVSASYGYPGQTDHPVVKQAIETGRSKVLASGKQLLTLAKSTEQVQKDLSDGIRSFMIDSDLQMLSKGFSQAVQEIKEEVA